MSRLVPILLAIPLLLCATFFSGCEDDDSPSGTATVTGNVRQFYSPGELTQSSTAKAAAGVTVELRLKDGSYSKTVTSGADGSFTFKDVPAGEFELVLSGGGLTGTLEISVTEGATVELVDIIVKADGTIREGAIVKTEPDPEEATAPVVAAQPVTKTQWVDQQQTAGGFLYTMNGFGLAQVFTIGSTSGSIFKIELDLQALAPGGTVDITAQLVSSVDLDPSGGALLATATIPGASIGAGLEVLTFSPPIPVSTGSIYVITLTCPTDPGGTWAWNSKTPGAPYAGGQAWRRLLPAGWVAQADTDFAFKVWMEN